MKHTLPPLGYDYNALEPYIDEQTMKIHHSKHHQTYVDKFNAAIDGIKELENLTAEEILKDLPKVPEKNRTAVKNHGGGHVNHSFFWTLLKKNGGHPSEELSNTINESFGSFEEFKKQFNDTANTRFGSGWSWLVYNKGKLEIIGTSNQDTPLSEGKTPLLTLDVWEHAYYLKYQNRRAEYTEAFWNIINWETVNTLFEKASKK